jgi:hypothetical protein
MGRRSAEEANVRTFSLCVCGEGDVITFDVAVLLIFTIEGASGMIRCCPSLAYLPGARVKPESTHPEPLRRVPIAEIL